MGRRASLVTRATARTAHEDTHKRTHHAEKPACCVYGSGLPPPVAAAPMPWSVPGLASVHECPYAARPTISLLGGAPPKVG